MMMMMTAGVVVVVVGDDDDDDGCMLIDRVIENRFDCELSLEIEKTLDWTGGIDGVDVNRNRNRNEDGNEDEDERTLL